MEHYSLMSTLYSIACAFALLVSAGNLIKKNKTAANVLFAFLMADFAVMIAHAGARYSMDPGMSKNPSISLVLLAGCGILIYMLFVSLAGLSTERKKRNAFPCFLLLPALISDILIFGFNVGETGGSLERTFVHSLNIGVWAVVLFLCAVAIIHVFKLYSPKTMNRPSWAIFMISATITLSFMLGLSGFLLSNARLFAVMDGFISILIVCVALLDYRYPDALMRFREETVKRRYERSLLAGFDVAGLVSDMKEMLTRTALYRNEGFSLELLAQRMGLSAHQVSELLNDRMGTNFSAFINGFRIETAKNLLVSNPDMTILTVAMEAGFGNKTSFNEAFKRQVSMTPRQFRDLTIKKVRIDKY